MSKELNALECLEALEQDIKDRTILAEDRQLKLCEVIKQALQRLEAIDNANPSEALKGLHTIAFNTQINGMNFGNELRTIEQAILKVQEKETGYKPSYEVISRDELCEAVDRIFGSEEKFLDIIEEDIPYGYHYYKYDGEEIYIIDRYHNKYINWYKLTHIGRDFHTDMKTKEEVIDFLQRLHDDWLKENE